MASSADVKTAAESLIGKVDAIVIGQDNTVASALEAVVKTANDNGLPLFAMDPQAVERGAVASLPPWRATWPRPSTSSWPETPRAPPTSRRAAP